MQERLRAFILTQRLIFPNDLIFAAVSGGVDSMVMLDLLRRISDRIPFKLRVVHINHKVRGAASDADEALVEEQARHHKIPYEGKSLSGLHNLSSEEELRKARYSAFEEILLRYPASKIATAHHLDDQLETFLMRLAKGAGLKGLSAIPVKRDGFIRPLLAFRRSEIETYAAQNRIPFREDRTNADIAKLRNHIRHTLVPVVKDVFGPSFYQGFRKSLTEIQAHRALFMEENEEIFRLLTKISERECRLLLNDYSKLAPLRRRAIFQYCVSLANPLTLHVSDDLWLAFDRFVSSASTGARFQAAGHLFVRKNRKDLLFYSEEADTLRAAELYVNEAVHWGGYVIRLKQVNKEELVLDNDRRQEFFCADQVLLPLTVRSWREGDFFYPLGMKGKKKLSDFFVDQKIDWSHKSGIPLVCNGPDIVWVAGLRLDNRFKIKKECKKIYQIKIENKGSGV